MTLIFIVSLVFRIYSYMILARVLLSWFPVDPMNPLVRILVQATEPVLGPCRDLLNSILSAIGVNPMNMGIDFSPMVAYLLLDWLVRPAVIKLLIMLTM